MFPVRETPFIGELLLVISCKGCVPIPTFHTDTLVLEVSAVIVTVVGIYLPTLFFLTIHEEGLKRKVDLSCPDSLAAKSLFSESVSIEYENAAIIPCILTGSS